MRVRNNHSAPFALPDPPVEIPGTAQRDHKGQAIAGTAQLKPIGSRLILSGEIVEVDPEQRAVKRAIELGYLVHEFDPRPQKHRHRGVPIDPRTGIQLEEPEPA